MSVTVADNTRTMTLGESIGEQPLEGAPGRMDLHRCFEPGIMSLVNVRVSSSNEGVYDSVLFLKCFKKL